MLTAISCHVHVVGLARCELLLLIGMQLVGLHRYLLLHLLHLLLLLLLLLSLPPVMGHRPVCRWYTVTRLCLLKPGQEVVWRLLADTGCRPLLLLNLVMMRDTSDVGSATLVSSLLMLRPRLPLLRAAGKAVDALLRRRAIFQRSVSRVPAIHSQTHAEYSESAPRPKGGRLAWLLSVSSGHVAGRQTDRTLERPMNWTF